MKKTVFLVVALLANMAAFAVCSGSSTIQDAEYTAHDTYFEWENDYMWTCETTSAGVVVTFAWEDEFDGATCYLFDKTDNGFREIAMAVSGKTATTTLTGYPEGKALTLVVKMMCSKGQAFSDRFSYVVGENCTDDVNNWCEGSSTAVDEHYTSGDPAHAVAMLQYGYTWKIRTTNAGIELYVTFLENLLGMTAPYLFDFSAGEGTMTEYPMAWAGKTASYTFSGHNVGDELLFLVKIAAAEGKVIFTERIAYTVGEVCTPEDETAIPEIELLEGIYALNGTIYGVDDMQIFTITGLDVTNENGSLSGIYVVKSNNKIAKVVVK